MQQVIVFILFGAAIVYLGYLFYRSFSAKKQCGETCGCSAVDLKKIEKEIEEAIAKQGKKS